MLKLILSTDGKNSVWVEIDKVADKNQLDKVYENAKYLYDKITADLGTKPKMWEEVMNGNGHANKPAAKPSKTNEENCPHDGGVMQKISHSENNPDRPFLACRKCGKFIRWAGQLSKVDY